MSEPNAEAVIKAAKHRKPAAPEPVSEPVPLSPIVANPFADETGKSLADDGQRVN